MKNHLVGNKYIIFDANRRDLNYSTVDENYEIINKLSNPCKVLIIILTDLFILA